MIAQSITAIVGSMEFHNLFRDGDTWVALVADDEGLWRGSGDSPEEALASAASRETFAGTLFGTSVALGIRPAKAERPRINAQAMLAQLGLKRQPLVTRR